MKRILKVIIGIIILLIILWGIIFFIDYTKCAKLEMPIFVIARETADDGGSGTYYGLGYKVEVEKNLSAQYGAQITKIEMYIFNKFITGAITEMEDIESKASNTFVGTILEEKTTYMIVEPNEDEVERKTADKIVINYGTDHRDYLFGIGRKVVISYTGYIMETYPAQINTDNISVEGYSDFEISVVESETKESKKILNNNELYKYNSDYDLYYYGVDEVKVTVDNKTFSLEDALRSGKVTIDKIVSNANRDLAEGIITGDMYKEGGTMEYHYENFAIIKSHSLDGNRDVYIGIPEMRLNDVR